MSYRTWKTKDGREIPVEQMSDTHLLNCIWGIREGHLFATTVTPLDRTIAEACDIDLDLEDFEEDSLTTERSRWLTVFTGEALKRGLDLEQKPVRRVSLIDWLVDEVWPWMSDYYKEANRKAFRDAMNQHKIQPPEIDVSNLTGKPSYCHWQAGGTPLTEGANERHRAAS